MSSTNLYKEQFSKIVCLFLSELLRTHRVSLKRAAEIAKKVLYHLNIIHTEEDLLALLKDLQSDFQELSTLEKRVLRKMQHDERTRMEEWVRDFVIKSISSDPQLSLDLLEEAAKDSSTLQDLESKFPEFNQFLETYESTRKV